MNDPSRLDRDERLVERFFERQRREILHRVAQREDERRFRRSLLALAASAVLVTVLLGGGLFQGPPAPRTGLAWIENAALTEPLATDDALALFGEWDEGAVNSADATMIASPLPPLELDVDDDGLGDIDFDPFLPNGSEANDALAS